MNKTLRNIAERYSCRDFTGEPPTDGEIEAIVSAALAAPSAINLQPWHIVVVRDKAIVDELDSEGLSILAAAEDKSSYERISSRGRKMLYNAPCIMIILSDGSKWATLDSGILCQTIVLAAQSLGLATCIVGMAGVPLYGPKRAQFAKRLRFPEGYEFSIGVLIGTANSGKQPHELDAGKVTYV